MNTKLITAAVGLAAIGTVAQAQTVPTTGAVTETTVTTKAPTANGNGAEVLQGTATTTTTTTADDGKASVDTSVEKSTEVSTPSGNVTTVTRATAADGAKSTTVEHDMSAHTTHAKKPK